MNRQTLKRLMVKGTIAYVAVFSLVLMVAMPAMALMANSVGTKEIKNHSIRSADIRNKAVTTDRIAPRAVRRGKIGKRAIRTEHIKSISGSKIKYSTKTRYLSVPGIALRPETNDDGFYPHVNDGCISAGAPSTGWVYFYAPVNLPDGAVVTNVRYNVYDNDLTYSSYAQLRRSAYSDSTTESSNSMSILTSLPGASTSWQNLYDNTIGYSTIDNSQYRYFLKVRLHGGAGSNLKAGGIIITYQVTGP